jgi:CMP-N-acetylneuraminic acid synthetase
MYLGKSFLAVIPARAGSKRLKNKNMRSICGRPLTHWVIEAAKDSEIFNEVVVLSDDKNLIDYARSNEGIRGIVEPSELATNTAYVGDALIWLINSGFIRQDNPNKPGYSMQAKYDYIQLIEPTAPLLRPAMIKNAAKYLIDNDADFVISMCPAEAPNGVCKPLPGDPNGRAVPPCVTDWWPEELFAKRSQDCEMVYRVDGLIYVGKPEIWLQRNYWKSKIYAFITDKRDSVDINEIRDFEVAEAVLARQLRGRSW